MSSSQIHEGLGLLAFLILCFGVAGIGAHLRPGAWYARLAKPSWTPANRVFTHVWIVLFLMMAVAGWLVWREAGLAGASIPLGLFALQLAFNAIWSWLFFGLQRPDLAFVDIVALWLAIAANVATFWGISPIASMVMLPYLAWVSFALLLNLSIWRLNR